MLIHSVDDFAGKPQLRIVNVDGDIVAGADSTNTVVGECDCSPVQFATFRTQDSVTLPAGLKSVTVRNKGAGSVYVAGKELCPPATAPSTPCGNCAGESLTLDAGCGVYGQPISVNIPNGCAEIYLEWSPNPLLDMTDSDGDGVPDWLEALDPCLALSVPDVPITSWSSTAVIGKAWSAADAGGLLVGIPSWSDPAVTIYVLPDPSPCQMMSLVNVPAWAGAPSYNIVAV